MNAVAYFADALSRERPLTSEETDRLCAAMGCDGTRRMWKAADDRNLLRMKRQRLTAQEIADKLGRTVWSVRSRVRTLRAKGKMSRSPRVIREKALPKPMAEFDAKPVADGVYSPKDEKRAHDTLFAKPSARGKRQSRAQAKGTAVRKIKTRIKRKERDRGV